jgi:hypothetical protein
MLKIMALHDVSSADGFAAYRKLAFGDIAATGAVYRCGSGGDIAV